MTPSRKSASRGIPRTGTAGFLCGVALGAALVGCMFAAMSPPSILTLVGLLGLVGIGAVLGWMARGDWER